MKVIVYFRFTILLVGFLFFIVPVFLHAEENKSSGSKITVLKKESEINIYKANRFTISGYVKDEKTGELLIGANICLKGEVRGVSSNSYGF